MTPQNISCIFTASPWKCKSNILATIYLMPMGTNIYSLGGQLQNRNTIKYLRSNFCMVMSLKFYKLCLISI